MIKIQIDGDLWQDFKSLMPRREMPSLIVSNSFRFGDLGSELYTDEFWKELQAIIDRQDTILERYR